MRQRDVWDWYVLTFATVVVGAMTASFVSGVSFPLTMLPAPLMPMVMAAAVTVVGTGVGVVAWLLGPVTVGSAEVWWILSGTVDRGQWLHHPFAKTVCLGALAGLVAAVIVWAAMGPGTGWAVALALTPLTATFLMLLAQQGRTNTHLLLGAVGLLAVTWSARAWVLVAALATAAVVAGVVGWRGLGNMSRYDLLRVSRSGACQPW